MKKLGTIQFVVILVCASLLAGCGSAVQPNANSGAAAVNTPTVAASTASNPTAPASTPTTVPAATLAVATPAAPATASQDACTLITKDDVSKVFGQTFVAAAGAGMSSTCTYTYQLTGFTLTITHTGGTQFMQTTRTRLGDSALDVPGLGDEALFNVNSSTLFVRKGEAVYMLSYLDSMTTQDDKIAKDTVLAGLLLSRLN